MNPVQHILVLLVRLYRWTLSPAKTFVFGPTGNCRFEPSCSQYALEAVKTHGAISGGWLAVKRVCRCHPWGGCGHDPVPQPPMRSVRKVAFSLQLKVAKAPGRNVETPAFSDTNIVAPALASGHSK